MDIKKEVLDFISKDYENKGKSLDDFDVLTNTECVNYIIDFYNYMQLIIGKIKNIDMEESKVCANNFEKELFKLVNNYCKQGLKKPDLISKMEWVLGSCKIS